MAMSTKFTYDQVNEMVKNLDNALKEVEATETNMLNSVEDAKSMWEGDGFAAFANTTDLIDKNLKRLQALMSEGMTAAGTAAKLYADADTTAAQTLNGVNTAEGITPASFAT